MDTDLTKPRRSRFGTCNIGDDFESEATAGVSAAAGVANVDGGGGGDAGDGDLLATGDVFLPFFECSVDSSSAVRKRMKAHDLVRSKKRCIIFLSATFHSCSPVSDV